MRKFICKGEAVLILNETKNGSYFTEANVSAVHEPLEDALRGLLDEHTKAVYLLDTDTMKTPEVITEEAAAIWLREAQIHPHKNVPPFVRDSDAFEAYAEEYFTKNGITQRSHGTLNALHGSVN